MNVNVTQILRPLRLAILIRPNNKLSYLRAVRVCSFLWGGKYFPIFPIYKRFTKDFCTEYVLFSEQPIDYYSKSIENFDPDYVVVEENLDSTFINKIKGDRTILSLSELEESIFSNGIKFGVSIKEILVSIREIEFKYERNDKLKIVLPVIKPRDLFLATLYGCATLDSEAV